MPTAPPPVVSTPSISPVAPGAVAAAPSISPASPGGVAAAPSISPVAPGAVASHPSISPGTPGAVASYTEPNGGTATAMLLTGDAMLGFVALAGYYYPDGTSNGKPIYVKTIPASVLRLRMVAISDNTLSPTEVRWRIEMDVGGTGSWNRAYVQTTGNAADTVSPDLVSAWSEIEGLFDFSGTITDIEAASYTLPLPAPGSVVS